MRNLLIVDVDDTLFDWLSVWNESFGTLLAVLHAESRLPGKQLIQNVRVLHAAARTNERGFDQADAEALGVRPAAIAAAMDDFELSMRERTKLSDQVASTLLEVAKRGVRIVAHTDAPRRLAEDRVARLGLQDFVDAVFVSSREADLHRRRLTPSQVGRFVQLPYDKPSPASIAAILRVYDSSPEDCVYVGDSKPRDVVVAREAGVLDIHAAYAGWKHPSAYRLLDAVSPWTEEDAAAERASATTEPSITLPDFGSLRYLF